MKATVKAWCCGVAADHELGETRIYVYDSKESCEADCPCTTADPSMCAPRELTITFETDLISERLGTAQQR